VNELLGAVSRHSLTCFIAGQQGSPGKRSRLYCEPQRSARALVALVSRCHRRPRSCARADPIAVQSVPWCKPRAWPHIGHTLALVAVNSCVLLSGVFAARRLFCALTSIAADMINLSWKLAMVLSGQARQELLDTYQSDRLPVIRRLVEMTERATRAFNSTNPVVHAALTRLAPIVLARSRVQDKAAPRLGQLAAGYRDCPIAKGGGRLGSLRAGDRVPDFRVGTGRLYDSLDLSRLTLVLTGDRAPEAYRPWRDIVALRRVSIDDMPSGWLLVRPDGYLAAAGGPDDGRVLSRWLDRWFIAPAR
jgi:FAD binding domain-containing protein/aromatic ring hydroxylase-like protein